MKTYFVHLNTTVITVITDGVAETLTFRSKKAADKKLLKLIAAGYTFDRFGWAAQKEAPTSNPDYAPTPEHSF
jgi:hypothetical protein